MTEVGDCVWAFAESVVGLSLPGHYRTCGSKVSGRPATISLGVVLDRPLLS
jgi:hypothetical protein